MIVRLGSKQKASRWGTAYRPSSFFIAQAEGVAILSHSSFARCALQYTQLQPLPAAHRRIRRRLSLYRDRVKLRS